MWDDTFSQIATYANPTGLPGDNVLDMVYDPITDSFWGLVTTGEGGTGTESDTLVRFDLGGAVLDTVTIPFQADGIGRNECP